MADKNPISEQWNSEEQLCLWRANWADAVNKMLALNQINAAIDHRSFAAQGITEQPTIHEGYIAQNMEKKGMVADRCEINRRVRADNRILRELKTQIKKIGSSCRKIYSGNCRNIRSNPQSYDFYTISFTS